LRKPNGGGKRKAKQQKGSRNRNDTQFIINHLWQSSCFVPLAGLLAFVLRKNSPKVRYWVWLSASLKFLVPFALLVSLGGVVPRPARGAVSVAAPVLPSALLQIAEPFSPASPSTVPAHASIPWVPVAIGILWALGFFAITLVRCRSWVRIRASMRAGRRIELPIPMPAFIAPGAAEPGIVGFLRPVLILPTQLLEHLNPRQLDAVLAHELCHVRRRDNLFAAVHMVVEAIFWFHPLVWWIGSRMVEERERACDEEVLRMGCEPTDYVEAILKVCRFYTESPLPCVSGVTGADVKERLRAILTGKAAPELNLSRKLLLALAAVAAFAVPIAVGVLDAPAIRA
jgi:bla regulator protein blaR1